MMSQPILNHTKKPSLPSIQFLLNDSIDTPEQPIPITTTTPPISPKRHQKQSSISSLPSELQQLSLSAPAYSIPERSENQQPSWMMMAPSSTPPPTSKRTHTRSVSDLSMVHNLVHLPPQVVRNKHKRSVSANTTTFFHHNHQPLLPHIDEHTSHIIRAHTDSPPQQHHNIHDNNKLSDALNINNHSKHPTLFLDQVQEEITVAKEYENVIVARDEHTGRYYCPFCNKAFNRPSSLRIHTYSHTGEKPFVCPEEGCGRQFSVQSNMRRHLRVHRIGGRSSKASSK